MSVAAYSVEPDGWQSRERRRQTSTAAPGKADCRARICSMSSTGNELRQSGQLAGHRVSGAVSQEGCRVPGGLDGQRPSRVQRRLTLDPPGLGVDILAGGRTGGRTASASSPRTPPTAWSGVRLTCAQPGPRRQRAPRTGQLPRTGQFRHEVPGGGGHHQELEFEARAAIWTSPGTSTGWTARCMRGLRARSGRCRGASPPTHRAARTSASRCWTRRATPVLR